MHYHEIIDVNKVELKGKECSMWQNKTNYNQEL